MCGTFDVLQSQRLYKTKYRKYFEIRSGDDQIDPTILEPTMRRFTATSDRQQATLCMLKDATKLDQAATQEEELIEVLLIALL